MKKTQTLTYSKSIILNLSKYFTLIISLLLSHSNLKIIIHSLCNIPHTHIPNTKSPCNHLLPILLFIQNICLTKHSRTLTFPSLSILSLEKNSSHNHSPSNFKSCTCSSICVSLAGFLSSAVILFLSKTQLSNMTKVLQLRITMRELKMAK